MSQKLASCKLKTLRRLANTRKRKQERKTRSIARSKLEVLCRLANTHKRKQERKTGDEVGSIAGEKLEDSKTPKDVKSLAGSVLSQRAPQL